MLGIDYKKSSEITKVERLNDALYLKSELAILRLKPQAKNIVRVTYTQNKEFEEFLGVGILKENNLTEWDFNIFENSIELTTNELKIVVDKNTASLKYYDKKDKVLLCERSFDSHELSQFDSFKTIVDENTIIEEVDTPDGKKTYIKEANRTFDRKLYKTRLHLQFAENEKLYGLGQFEEGALNLRGTTQYLHQANLKIPVPMLLSTCGYGLLFSTGSTSVFSDTQYGSYFYTQADIAMDFYFIKGKNFDEIIKAYRFLTGKASLLPRWAFGFMQSQERYETQKEVLEIAAEYRKRKIGLDLLIMDWMSWPGEGWGQKSFDFERFPDPQAMTDSLHEDNIKFMISIWPNMFATTENYKEFKAKNLLLPASESYDALSEKARKLYWKQANEGLFSYGVDAWWCDSCEPFCPEWQGDFKPQENTMYHNFTEEASKVMPAQLTNTYPYYHAQTMYNGQRKTSEQKRVTNLTRATYTGGQQFGTIMWSGDTYASWQTFKNQIVAGLNFCATGIPYWTLDIGAFFVKKGDKWFRNGDYNNGLEDLGYRELFVRWFQYAVFLPVFRSHGTDVRREMWLFDGENHMFYDALCKANQLRYTLIAYIYSLAGKVWLEDYTMMRLLAFDFAEDEKACEVKDEFMFGDSILVCPITQACYYGINSQLIENPNIFKTIYLPQGQDWYDYYTGKKYAGGQKIKVEIELDKIPLFVKAGSIIPTTEPLQYADEIVNAEITWQVYTGKDAIFDLYEDSGDGYGYEKGEYTLTKIFWDEKEQKLTSNTSDEKIIKSLENFILYKG